MAIRGKDINDMITAHVFDSLKISIGKPIDMRETSEYNDYRPSAEIPEVPGRTRHSCRKAKFPVKLNCPE